MILEGKTIKTKIIEELKLEVSSMDNKPSLVVIQVGDNPASNTYIKNKAKMCENIGYKYQLIKYPETITEEEILTKINNLNNDTNINAILVQMPLPKHLNELTIQNSINPLKDVDGLTDINMGKLTHNKDALYPCTAIGIIDLLDYYKINIEGKNIVIVGRSNLVGRPVAELFTNRNATITLCHSHTKNLSEITQKADILVVAVGHKHLITKDMVNHNTIIIDVGINNIAGKLYGDVDFDNLKDQVTGITPVPGGVGQMTVAELAKNILKAYNLQQSQNIK
jgi:methylenetetrahydrofolate dehydrogenase (NADP+)/methenyltetrahydrofolate cyclohydrolase